MIKIVDLGPGAPEALTYGAIKALEDSDNLFFRTEKHPTVDYLKNESYTLILHLVLLLRDIRFNIVTNIYEATLDITAPKIFILGIGTNIAVNIIFKIHPIIKFTTGLI